MEERPHHLSQQFGPQRIQYNGSREADFTDQIWDELPAGSSIGRIVVRSRG